MKPVAFEIGRITGALAGSGAIVLWLIFLFGNPYNNQGQSVGTVLTVIVMLLLGALSVLASLANRPYLMAFLAAAMFVPVGLYTLGTPGLFRWIGLFEIVYFGAALLMIAGRIRKTNPGSA